MNEHKAWMWLHNVYATPIDELTDGQTKIAMYKVDEREPCGLCFAIDRLDDKELILRTTFWNMVNKIEADLNGRAWLFPSDEAHRTDRAEYCKRQALAMEANNANPAD